MISRHDWTVDHVDQVGTLMAKHGLTMVHFDGLTVERPANAGAQLPVAPPPVAEPTDDELLADPYAGMEAPHGS